MGAFKKLSDLCVEACKNCNDPEPYRCCDKMFCNIVAKTYKGEQPNIGGLPFMGEKGCVVPPDQRPMCTGFVCPDLLADRGFRREYERLCEKAKIPAMKRR